MAKIYPRKDDLQIGNRYWASWKAAWLYYSGTRYITQDECWVFVFKDIYGRITTLTENELPALRITN